MKTWTCAGCRAVNDVRQRVCDNCGAEPVRHLASAPSRDALPVYREMPKREYSRAAPSDRCTEPDCDKTVAEHQAELKAALTRIQVRSITAVGFSRRKDDGL